MRISRLVTEASRPRLVYAVHQAPLFSRFTLQGPRRSNSQNALMWVLLEAFANQVTHFERRYDSEVWKCIFLKSLGKELQFVPSLDGDEIVALGYRSSELSKEEMADMIELIFSEGTKRGVNFEARDGSATPG